MYSSTATSFGMLLASLATALAESTIPGYAIVPLSWEVAPVPGGPNITLNGTVQDVHAQLLQINPRYEADFGISYEKPPVHPQVIHTLRKAMSDHICGGPWQKCAYPPIVEGVAYLRGVPGRPNLPAGPSICSRVSCSWNSAIYWCSDHKDAYSLNSFDQIANSARWIADTCYDQGATSGQNFEADSWNTIVRFDHC